MNICVCLKQVPDSNAVLHPNADGSDIDRSQLSYVINPYDEVALEAALRIKEAQTNVVVTVLSLGPERVQAALRTALALGADHATQVLCQQDLNSIGTAKILAAVLRARACDLILCGKQAVDTDAGVVGPALAGILGWPQLCVARKLTLVVDTIHAELETDEGLRSRSAVLPVVVTAQLGFYEPRFPSLAKVLKAKQKMIEVVDVTALLGQAPADQPHTMATTIKLETPPPRAPAQMLTGTPAAQAQQLLKILREELRVL